MNAWLSWRPDERIAQVVRGALRRGTRMSHHLFSIVGGIAVVLLVLLVLSVRRPPRRARKRRR